MQPSFNARCKIDFFKVLAIYIILLANDHAEKTITTNS